MTTPKLSRLADWVLANLPGMGGRIVLTPQEESLAAHLRGNTPLQEAINEFINARLRVRDTQPVPTDPMDCRATLERQAELRWLLARLDLLYRSPVNPAAQEDGEPPA